MADAVRLAPDRSSAYAELGRALIGLNKEEEALIHLRGAIELNPADLQTMFVLLRLSAGKKLPEAEDYGQKLRSLKQDEISLTQAQALSNFALAAANEENWTLAVKRLREAISACGECPAKPVLRKNLGPILAQSRDVEGAALELENARQLDPEDKDILYALKILPKLKNR